MIDQNLLTQASIAALERGVRLLQGYRLADTDAGHIDRLLDLMRPIPHAYILDIGSGFGEAARLMREARPDLEFALVNNNRFQLAHTANEFIPRYGDMHALPFENDVFDVAMFLYSLCHADDLRHALCEAARVTRPGGALFIYDYLRNTGDNRTAEWLLCSRFHTLTDMCIAFDDAGWESPKVFRMLHGNDVVFRRMIDDCVSEYEHVMQDLTPVVWKAIRA